MRKLLTFGTVFVIIGCSISIALAYSAARQFTSDSREVTAVARSITDFELPSGYQPDYAAGFLGFSLAAFDAGPHTHLMLLQAPAGVQIDLRGWSESLTAGQAADVRVPVRAIGQEQRTVRGQPATLLISEGRSSDGTVYRQYSLVFEGLRGTALLQLTEPDNGWNNLTADALIASLN
jgi:hypothetical protein